MISKITKKVLTERQFPKLMIWNNERAIKEDIELIVLFEKPDSGVVIHCKNSTSRYLGEISTNYLMREFVDFDGTVNLSNV